MSEKKEKISNMKDTLNALKKDKQQLKKELVIEQKNHEIDSWTDSDAKKSTRNIDMPIIHK